MLRKGMPAVQGGLLLVSAEGSENGAVTAAEAEKERAIVVGTGAWYAWLEQATVFTFTNDLGVFTARKERFQRGGSYWRAYRRRLGRLRRVYLGKSEQLGLECLEAAAQRLAPGDQVSSSAFSARAGQEEAAGYGQQRLPLSGDYGAWEDLGRDLHVPLPALPIHSDSLEHTGRPDAAHHASDTSKAQLPLLATKLSQPLPPRDLLSRRRLTQKLQQYAAEAPLTAIVAPAGYGKTTLLAEWATTCAPCAGWVALDRHDNDPVRFWLHALAALELAVPGLTRPCRSLLEAGGAKAVDMALAALANTLVGRRDKPAPIYLVLDDYHEIAAQPIHDGLVAFVDHAPTTLRVIAASREELPPTFARLIAGGQVARVSAEMLRFTEQESLGFLAALPATLSANGHPNDDHPIESASASVSTTLTVIAKVSATDSQLAVSTNLRRLVERIEGWAAGLRLASIVLSGHAAAVAITPASASVSASTSTPGLSGALGPDTDPIVTLLHALARGEERTIADYLSEEVLRRLPEAVRDFLLETSVLERLCGPLCDAVTACAAGHSEDLLDHLERAQVFLTPLDAGRRWYRSHPLFAAVLRARLQTSEHGEEHAAVAHARAARWLATHGAVEEAITHALAGARGATGDVSLAAQLIEEHGPTLYRRGETATVSSWLEALPAAVTHGRPRLALLYAQALLATSRTAEAEPLIAAAERALACNCQEDLGASGIHQACEVCDATRTQLDGQRLRGEVLAARATIAASCDDFAAATAAYQRALTLIPETDTIVRASIASDLSAMMAFSGQLRQATAAQRKALEAYQASGDHVGMLESLWCLGTLLYSQGALPTAAHAFQGAIDLAHIGSDGGGRRGEWRSESRDAEADVEVEPGARGGGALLPAAAAPYHFLARVYYEWDRRAEAALLNETGMRLNIRNGDAGLEVRMLWLLGRLRRAAGDEGGVRECMRRAEQLQRAPGIRRTVTRLAGAVGARLALVLGDVESTDAWAREIGLGLEVEMPFGPQDEFARLTFLRLLLAQRRLDDAAVFLDRLEVAAATHAEWIDKQIELDMLRALVLHAQGDRSGALGALRDALAQAEPGGYVRIFLDEGAPMITLLAHLTREQQRVMHPAPISPTYLAKLLAAARSTATGVQDLYVRPRSSPAPALASGTVGEQHAATHASLDPLSKREVEIVQRLAAGMSNAEIARDLVVEPSTVKWHVHNILDKLGVRNRAGAVARAQSLGLL